MKNVGMIVLAIAALGAAVYMTSRYMNKTDETGEMAPTMWLCTSDKCGAEFTKTPREVLEANKANADGAMACPTCGSMKTIRATQCGKCLKFMRTVGHGQLPDKCPHCGAETQAVTGIAPPGS